NAPPADSALGLGELRNVGTEVVHLRHVAALAARRSRAHDAARDVIDEIRSGDPGITRGPALGMNRGAHGSGQQEVLAVKAGRKVKAVRVEPDKELVLTSKHPVELADVLIEVLYRGYGIRDAAIGQGLRDGEVLRQVHGDGADGIRRNHVAGNRQPRGGVIDLDYSALGIDSAVRGQVIRE